MMTEDVTPTALDEILPQERPRDEQGRFQAQNPQPQNITGDAPAQSNALEAGTPPQEADDAQTVPLKALQAERQKRQEQEDFNRRMARELEEIKRQVQPRQPEPEIPDPETEPGQYAAYLAGQQRQKEWEIRCNMSAEIMRSQHKDYDEVETVFAEAARQNPVLARELYNHPVPARFAYEQGKRIKEQQDYAASPDAFRAKIKAELLAEMKGQASSQADNALSQLPNSLAAVTSAAPRDAGSQQFEMTPLDAILKR